MNEKRNLRTFNDILVPRREEFSNFLWVSRKLDLQLAYEREIKPNPHSLKLDVLDSLRMQQLIDNICATGDVSRNEVVDQVRLILDEIGFKKQLKVIRWLGYVLAKICRRVCSGIYVNELGINKLKSRMGNCPVIFAPSHRSYADFILMSYLLFTYDIEIPSIAAGMDFHGMVGMGTMLRNTGAFFMRRSYNDDRLYWDTFKAYVHQLVTRGELPIEFFIEGTRSRSCKSLTPKFGLLSMLLRPFFIGEVPDILIVPINISYDRVLEERLFAFELLGVPKPKESTSGFFKSLSIVKEKYGNIYVDFCEPVSLRSYFGNEVKRQSHSVGPLHHQQLSQQEKHMVSSIAYDVVHMQQLNTVITNFNISSLAMSHILMQGHDSLSSSMLLKECQWIRSVLETCGALLSDLDAWEDMLQVHKNLLEVDTNGEVRLKCFNINLDEVKSERLRGARLSNQTMDQVVPRVFLQIYANPCLFFLINLSLVEIVLKKFSNKGLDKDELFGHFQFLRNLFSYEFVFHTKWELTDFENSIRQLNVLQAIQILDNKICLTDSQKLHSFLCNLLLPFFTAYQAVYQYLLQEDENTLVEQSRVLKDVQGQLEVMYMESQGRLHPYCLNLDTLAICLQSLSANTLLQQHRKNGKLKYKINKPDLLVLFTKIREYASVYDLSTTKITSKL